MVIMGTSSLTSGTSERWPLASDADRQRFAGYDAARAFFAGAQWNQRRKPGEVRLTFNYGRALLRKAASYVFPGPVKFSVPAGGDQHVANLAELLLAEFVAESNLSQLDIELCIEAAVAGDAAIKVSWNAVERRPVVAAVDPATLVARCRDDNPRQLLEMHQRYALSGNSIAAAFPDTVRSLVLEPERLYPVVESWTDERWQVELAGQTLRDEPNPYGWIPYVVLPNNPQPHAFWGESDLVDLYDVCRELNTRMSVLAKVLEVSGAPIAVLENVDGSEGISVGPGAKWELPEGSKAYLLDLLGNGGVRLHIDYIDLLFRALHDLSETPRTAFGDSGRTISGAALEVEIQPLVQKVARKRRQWDVFYQARNARLLDLLERFGDQQIAGLRRTVAIWPGVLPSDREVEIRNAVALVESGIQSRRTSLATLGNADPEGELERIVVEQTASRRPQAASLRPQAQAADGAS